MQEEGGGSFWATFGGGTNGAEVRHVGHVLLPVGLADSTHKASGLEKLLQTPKCSVEAFDQLEEIGDVNFFVEKCANDRTPIRSVGKVGLKVLLHRRTCPPLCNRSSDQNYCGASTVPPFRPC